MREQENHAHATSRYTYTQEQDYINLLQDVFQVRLHSYTTLTVHLPFEIQHPAIYTNLQNGIQFIEFGESLKKVFQIQLYWENSPELVYGDWALKFGQTDWTHVPGEIDLCLDVGHLMIGCVNDEEARIRIREIVKDRGNQIRHLHIHENDLLHDDHLPIGKIITTQFLEEIISDRTYIFERGEVVP
jgi:hypothetical protein